MPRAIAGLTAICFLLATFPAAAQAPATPVLAGSKVVEELEVVARLPGPALWKASKPDSELFILGAVTPIRHLQAWDTTRIENAIQDAVVVLLPPEGKVGMFDAVLIKLNDGSQKLSGGRKLQQVLSPAQRARFERLIKVIGRDWKPYERLKPGVAGVQLISDFRRAAGLSDAKPGSTVERLAKAHGTPSRPVAAYRLKPLLKTLTDLSEPAHLACLNDAMDEMEYESAHTTPAGKAWAEHDMAGVRANYAPNRLERCLQAAPTLDALLETTTADTANALKLVLNRPGKTVAVVDLALLLRANGVLDRLKADGAVLSVPTQ